MQTGENEQGLRKILDMTRLISIILLLLHFYFYCYAAFHEWRFTAALSDRLLTNITRTGLFNGFHRSKLLALAFLVISLLGARGRKAEKITYRTVIHYTGAGLLLYFGSYFLFDISTGSTTLAILYMTITSLGFLLLLAGGTLFSRVIRTGVSHEVFNRKNETFPQEERRLVNRYSFYIPTVYQLKGKIRNGVINLPNPFSGLILTGRPGCGKTRFILIPILKQQIRKGYSLLLYDFKYDDLSKIAYNYFIRYRKAYPPGAAFYNINFDDLDRTHRCNPLTPDILSDITDAAESSRTILLGLNMEWVNRQGSFFVESPINFVTALIWFLRCYKDGKYCTWAHVIELAQVPYKQLFSVLRTEPELEALLVPFINAYNSGAMEQLEGQIASATISLAKLSSPQLYYVITGNDFSLDINNPRSPKLVCLGNNPQKTGIYGAMLSVYINTITRLCNKKGRRHMAFDFEEFSTILANSIDKTIATGRSNKLAVVLVLQDASQLRLAYGKEYADVILNTCGNVISGQVSGETAKQLSERFGKIMQDRESYTTTSSDTNITRSRQMDQAIPVSTIATLSSGEFVGIVADTPDQEISQKIFHGKVVLDNEALKKEEALYKELPVIRRVTRQTIHDNYLQIKKDIADLIALEIERMKNSPELEHLLIKKG